MAVAGVWFSVLLHVVLPFINFFYSLLTVLRYRPQNSVLIPNFLVSSIETSLEPDLPDHPNRGQILICLCFWNTTFDTGYNLIEKIYRHFSEYIAIITQPIIIPHMPLFGISELFAAKDIKTCKN